MMNDEVRKAPRLENPSTDTAGVDHRDAADEIERLRAELAEAMEVVNRLDAIRQSLIRDKQKLMARCKTAEAKNE